MYTLFKVLDEPSDSTEDLISLEDAKLELGITDSSQDALISSRISRASDIIAEFCDRRFAFASAEETFVFDSGRHGHHGFHGGEPGCRLALVVRLYPVEAVDSVTVDGVELDTSVYDVEEEAGIVRLVQRFGEWCGRVVVTYSGGYMLPDEAPGALQQACLEQVRVYNNAAISSSSQGTGIREIDHGDTRVVFDNGSSSSSSSSSQSSGGLSPIVVDLLGPFKRPAIA